MAYGLDFQEIYYADHNRIDQGVLQTYEIDIDLAKEKDFRIVSPEPVITVGGYWYIQDTEYGGIVDSFSTDSDEEKITYEGRSFRGMLDSHFVDVDGEERIIPENTTAVVDGDGAMDTDAQITATISECFTELIQEQGLDTVFVVDEPDIDESISPLVSEYSIKRGTTLYDALVGIADSIDFSFVLEYRSDHMIHIVPILVQDYTDYLKGSKYGGMGFETEIDTAVVNHVICAIVEDGQILRNIHVFADENGGIQPYATTDSPIKDEHYILDKRNQVLTGVDEICEYQESSASVVENYEPMTTAPKDWATNFGAYYQHNFDENGKESWDAFEATGQEVYTAVTKKPSGWNTKYSNYYTRSYDQQTGKYTYSNYSANTELNPSSAVAVKKKPSDWKTNYGEYYYKFQTGSGIEYRPYSSVSKDKYVRITKKPSDWNTNFGNYYRKVYKKTTGTGNKKKTTLVDTVNHKGAYYVACAKDDDKKNGKIPSFSKRAHYRKDSVSKPPTFLKNNCYRVRTREVAPSYQPANCYKMTMRYDAPKFVSGEAYKMVLDHYASAVESAIDFLADEQTKSSQTMSLDDFVVNIGDIVGGTDEFTGTSVVGGITNIEAKIENGLIDVSYSVTVEDYTTQINIGRLPELEEEE